MQALNPPFDQIILGDCVEVLKQLPEGCIPLTVTSPPYDNLRKFGGHPFVFSAIAEQLARVTAGGGLIAWVVQDAIINGFPSGTGRRQVAYFEQHGLSLYQEIILVVNGGRYPHRGRYAPRHHKGYILSKGKPRYVHIICDRPNVTAGHRYHGRVRLCDGTLRESRGGTVSEYGARGDVWYHKVGGCATTTDKVAKKHPALMPESMAEDLIISFSRPGDLVLDPMCGAATTCKMAHLNVRRYLGIEINAPYVADALERMEIAKQQQIEKLMGHFQEGIRT